VDAQGSRATDFAVIVFAEDRALRAGPSRFIAAGRPNQTGEFAIGGLPPGRYFAAAVDYLQPGDERDLDLLARIEPDATRVTLGEGETRNVTLKLTAN